MKLNLKIWRQAGPAAKGRLEDYVGHDISPDMSFLEMLDVVNEGLVRQGKDAIAFDRIIAAGGYISSGVGGAPDGNTLLIPKEVSETAMDSAACIGCGACVAACKNASAHQFMSAKISHLALLPQGQPERYSRVASMIQQADAEGFGSCSNEGECEAVCPKEIPISNIARMTREYVRALWTAGK
jgi:succinate dehydrogenase / fumarate reductase iron-sulfur subunit